MHAGQHNFTLQVVGLTASTGAGHAMNKRMAADHILELCANLAAAKISTVRNIENVEELNKYVNKPMEGNNSYIIVM